MTLENRDIAMFRQYAQNGPVVDKDGVSEALRNPTGPPIGKRFHQKVEAFTQGVLTQGETEQVHPLKTKTALDNLVHAFHGAPDVKSQQLLAAKITEFSTIVTALADIRSFYRQLHVPDADADNGIDALESQYLLSDHRKNQETIDRILDLRNTMELAVLQGMNNNRFS